MRVWWRRFQRWRARCRREKYEQQVWLNITRDYTKQTARWVND